MTRSNSELFTPPPFHFKALDPAKLLRLAEPRSCARQVPGLMDQVVTQENATAAWLAVKRNEGAPGIDGMTTRHSVPTVSDSDRVKETSSGWRDGYGGT